jgi:hypothetical protein
MAIDSRELASDGMEAAARAGMQILVGIVEGLCVELNCNAGRVLRPCPPPCAIRGQLRSAGNSIGLQADKSTGRQAENGEVAQARIDVPQCVDPRGKNGQRAEVAIRQLAWPAG